jgi:hypothetical protein
VAELEGAVLEASTEFDLPCSDREHPEVNMKPTPMAIQASVLKSRFVMNVSPSAGRECSSGAMLNILPILLLVAVGLPYAVCLTTEQFHPSTELRFRR